jgi:2-iminobutanoate/2-iminopropanoate deaminase
MPLHSVEPQNLPKPIGPYSPGVIAGGFFYSSGQIGLNSLNEFPNPNNITAQTKQIFENLKQLLHSAQLDFKNVVKVTVFLKNMNDFKIVNAIYEEHFEKPYPARSTVEVSALPKMALVEIEVIAKL